MTKRQICLYLDSEVLKELQLKNLNISESVNKYLRELIAPPKKPEDLIYQAALKEAEAADLKRVAEREREKLLKEAEEKLLNRKKFNENINAKIQEYKTKIEKIESFINSDYPNLSAEMKTTAKEKDIKTIEIIKKHIEELEKKLCD